MRASEILDTPVYDATHRRVGVVRDVRVSGAPHWAITGLVIGQPGWLDRAAHAWGFAQGRNRGPWLLRKLTGAPLRRARFVDARSVAAWASDEILLKVHEADLDPPADGVAR